MELAISHHSHHSNTPTHPMPQRRRSTGNDSDDDALSLVDSLELYRPGYYSNRGNNTASRRRVRENDEDSMSTADLSTLSHHTASSHQTVRYLCQDGHVLETLPQKLWTGEAKKSPPVCQLDSPDSRLSSFALTHSSPTPVSLLDLLHRATIGPQRPPTSTATDEGVVHHMNTDDDDHDDSASDISALTH